MPAIDLIAIYSLRPALEENISNAFTTLGLKAYTRLSSVDFQKVRPRVEVKITVGDHNGHKFNCPDGQQRYDQWAIALALQAVTEIPAKAEDNLLHELYVAQLRAYCSTLAQSSWNDLVNFPYHAIAEPLMETGTTNSLKSDDGLEFSILSLRGVVGVRKDAWPV